MAEVEAEQREDAMRINMEKVVVDGHGNRVDSRSFVWDTDDQPGLPCGYGVQYEFVGIEPPVEGGLSVVLRFKDAASLDSFRMLIRGIYSNSAHEITPEENERVTKFLNLLVAVSVQAPHSYYGQVGDDATIAANAAIMADNAQDDPDWPAAEEGTFPTD
jgi:hypothetical protein